MRSDAGEGRPARGETVAGLVLVALTICVLIADLFFAAALAQALVVNAPTATQIGSWLLGIACALAGPAVATRIVWRSRRESQNAPLAAGDAMIAVLGAGIGGLALGLVLLVFTVPPI
jgi:hypothetical protein